MADKLEIVIGAKDKFSPTFGKLKSVMGPLKTVAIAGGAAFAGGYGYTSLAWVASARSA